MLRVLKKLGRCALFHDASLRHHRHLVTQVLHHGEVVADEQVGDAQFCLQVMHQVQHLRLHRHVQRTDGFVRHDQLRPGDQGPRNGDTLALAAREFMRVFVEVAGAQAHRIQHVCGLHALLCRRGFAQCRQRLGHGAGHGLARVE